MSLIQSSARSRGEADPPTYIADNARYCVHYVSAGHKLSQTGLWNEAESCFRKAIGLNPGYPMAHNNLGWTLQMKGRNEDAVASYQKALQLDPNLRIARRNLGMLLIQLGRLDESSYLFYQEMLTGSEGVNWLTGLVTHSMQARTLTLAGDYAYILASLRWGSILYPPRKHHSLPPVPVQAPEVFLSVSKLRHDIEQFLYLQRKGMLGNEFTSIIKDYEDVIERLTAQGIKKRIPLDSDAQRTIGHVYNRIVHVRHTPRIQRALSDKWNPAIVESQYLDTPPGVVIIDDFLSTEALESLRLFCLESTVWSGNRYAHGRLGAFFHDGFNCPLLLQIAEEIRDTFPRVIGDRYPLRQLWGFKNGHYLPADSSTHADFAAVNVNFWITPQEANLDDTCGGLVVYGVDAPPDWDFHTYNGRPDIIKPYLQQQQASAINIPYQQNRAIIFNSDLFHGTAELKFHEGYENRRINITMLYGDRENDVHFKRLATRDATNGSNSNAWRSAAFTNSRRSTS